MKHLSSILFLLLLIPLQSQAADSKGAFAIWGNGNKSCHSYNVARDSGEDRGYKDYIMGYFTAFNVQTPETYRIAGKMDLDEILDWLDDNCGLKPVIAFEQSLADFIIENFEKRMKKSPSKYQR